MMPHAIAGTPERSLPRLSLVSVRPPRPSPPPSRCSTPSRTSSKNTSLVGESRMPIFLNGGPTVTPGIAALDDERRDASPSLDLRVDEEHVGARAVRDERLAARSARSRRRRRARSCASSRTRRSRRRARSGTTSRSAAASRAAGPSARSDRPCPSRRSRRRPGRSTRRSPSRSPGDTRDSSLTTTCIIIGLPTPARERLVGRRRLAGAQLRDPLLDRAAEHRVEAERLRHLLHQLERLLGAGLERGDLRRELGLAPLPDTSSRPSASARRGGTCGAWYRQACSTRR